MVPYYVCIFQQIPGGLIYQHFNYFDTDKNDTTAICKCSHCHKTTLVLHAWYTSCRPIASMPVFLVCVDLMAVLLTSSPDSNVANIIDSLLP